MKIKKVHIWRTCLLFILAFCMKVPMMAADGTDSWSDPITVPVNCPYNVDIIPSLPQYSVLCPGDILTLTAVPFGGTEPYTYLWSNGETTQSISMTIPSYGANFSVLVTDATGCVANDVAHLKYFEWTASITIDAGYFCQGQTANLYASLFPIPGNPSYFWSTGETTDFITISSNGTYTVTITDPDMPCPLITGTVEVTAFLNIPPPTPVITGPTSICSGESATLIAQGGPYASYVWEPTYASDNETLEITEPGVYILYVQNFEGCQGSDTFEVLSGAPLPLFNNPALICSGQSTLIEVLNASMYETFDWSTGESSSSITVSDPGTYTVTVTTSGGCSTSASVTIDPSGTTIDLTATTLPLTSCTSPNGSVDLSVSPAGNYTFDWSNGETTEDIFDLNSGNYFVTVTDAGGCTSSATFTVEDDTNPPDLSSTTTASSCNEDNGAIDLSVSPTGGYTYIWSNGESAEDLTNILAGTYSVTVTSSVSGCTASTSVTVNNTNPVINITGNTSPLTSCTSPNGAINITVLPTGTYTYVWSNGSGTEDLINLTSGSYTITVSAGGSCTATSSFSVADNTMPPMPVGTSTAAMCGQSNGAIDLNVTPAGTYTYLWSNGGMTEDLSAIPGGTYSVTVTSSNGCTNSTSVLVQDNSNPLVIAGTTIPNTSCTQPNGAIDITVSTPGTYTYAWSNGETSEDLQQLTGGTYSVTVTSVDGCTGSASFDIINTNSNFTFNGTVLPNTSCISPNGNIDVTVVPAGSYTFTWTNGASTEDVSNLSAGIFGVTVSDVNNCSSIASFTIDDQLSTPEISGLVTPSTCSNPNGAIDLTILPASGNTFSWSNASITEDLVNLSAGSYSVTVTDANGCMHADTFEVNNLNSNFTLAAVTMPNQSCLTPNGSIDLTVTPAGTYTYSWSNGTITEDQLNIPGGSFSVIVTDSLNCSASDTFLVANNTSAPILSAMIIPATCGVANGTIDLTIIPALNNTYLWSNGSILEDLMNINPGTYSVIVSDSNGCQALDTFAVQNFNTNFSLAASISPDTSCNNPNGTIDLTVTPPSVYTFAWSNGFMTEDISNLNAGSYIVTVTDTQSCSSTDTFDIINNTIDIAVSAFVTPESCGTSNGAIDLTLMPSFGNSILWSNGAMMEDLQNLTAGSYTVTVTGSNGCTSIDSFSVPAVGAVMTLSASLTPNTNCLIYNGAIDLTVIPNGTYSFNWSNGMSTEDLSNLIPGNYSVTVSDLNGCSSVDTLTIDNQIVLPSIAQSIIPSTCGNPNGQIDVTVSPPGTYLFEWSNGSTTEDQINVSSGTYVLTVTDINGCSVVASIIVTNTNSNFAFTATASANTSCSQSNGAIQLTITPPGIYTFLWSNGATSEDILNLQAGTYSITVTDASSCSSSESYTVVENVVYPIADETITPVMCGEANGSIDLTVTPPTGNSFIWSNGSNTEDLVNILPGQFSVTVTSQNGCTLTSSFNVPGSEIVELQLETDIIQAGDDSIAIRALVNIPLDAIDIVNWFPEPLFHCNQPFCLEQTIAKPLQQTEIRVMVIDTNGCMAEARLMLRADTRPEIYIPNVFSPNHDGINDFFTIYGNKDVEQIVELRIYDRWGNFVFTKNEFPPNIENYGWDGNFRNKEMNPAVFAYGATVLFKDGSIKAYKGDVTLVR